MASLNITPNSISNGTNHISFSNANNSVGQENSGISILGSS
jgi:dihydropteroate synthase